MIGAADLLLQQTVNNSPKPLGICGSKACLHTLAGREVTTALISDTLSGSLLFSEALAAFYGILSCAVSADQPTASIFAETGLRHVSAFFDSPSFPLKRAQLSYVFELLHSLLTVTACHGAVSKHFEDFSAVLRSTFDCIDTSNVPASVIDVLGILCSKGQFRATASGLGVAKLLSRIINASPKDDVVLRCLQILSQLNGNAIAPYADKLLDLFGSHVGKVGITALYIVLLVVSSECKYSKSSLYSKTIQCMQSVLDGPVSDNNTDALSLCLETFVRLTLDSPAFCEMFCYGCVLPLLRTPLRLKTAEFLLHMLDIDTTGSAFGKIEKVLPGNLAASISLEKSKALSERKKEWQRFSEKTESALDHLLHKRLVSLQGIKQEWEANSTAISQLQENHKAEIDAAYSQHIKSILSMEESLLRPVVIAAYEHEVEQGRIFVYDTQVLRQLVDSNSEQRRCARADLREQMNSLHFTTMTPTVSEERYKDNLTLKGVMPQVGMKYDRSNWQLPRVMQDSYLETLHKKHESQISYLNVSTAEFLSTHINKNLHADKLETAVNVTISLLQTPVDAASELAEQQSAQCELAGAPEQSLEQQQHIISLKERKLDHIKTLLHPYELSRERQLNTISELRREASEAMEKRMEKVAEVLEHVEQEDTKARIRTRSVLGAISEQEEVECRGLSKRYRGDLARLIADHGIKEQISTKELIIEVEKEKRTDLLSKRASAATFFEAVPSATGSQDIQRWTAKRLRSQNRDTTAVTQAAQYRSSHDASDITAPLITAVTRNENSDTTQHVLRMFERLCIEDEAMKQRKLEHSTHLSQQCRYKMRSVEESFERDMAAFVAAEVEIVQKCAAWHQYLSGFHTRLNTMIATDTARRKDLYKDEIDRAAEECSVITSCNELNPLDHPLIVSHVIQAWSLCRWVCNADMMREEMGRFQQYNPGAHVNIEERVRVAEARQRLVHGMKDKDTFYMAILEMLEEERCLALEAVQNAGGEAKELDALTALIATNARYDTLCDLAGIVTWGNSSLLNERIKDIRVTSLQGTPIHDCAAAYGITVAMTIALQETHESTQQNFEEFKKTIESLELEEASKAELQAVALFRSDDPEQKQSLQTQLDTVVSKRKELLQKQTAFTEAVIGIVNEGSLQREMAIKDLAQLLENAENLSQQDFEKMIEDEEWRFAEKEAAVEMKISDLEKQHDKQEISNGLCDLEAREIDLRKQIAASQLRRPLQTSDSTMQMNKYALQRSESLLTARKKAAASKASYQKKLAEIEKKVKAVVIRISGERSIVPDEQLQAEHENERMKLKVKLLRNQAADSLLKAEAEGNFQRRLSVSILQPQDKPSTRQSLDADISRRMHERAEYEYRLANRQQLEQDERTLLDEAKHVTDLKRVERERAAAVSNIRKTAPVSFKELCAKYMKNGKMTLDTKAFDKALQSQAGRTKECLEIEGAAIERKRSIIEKIRSSSTVPPVVKKLQDLLTCEESRLQGVVEFANAEEKEHTMLKAMLEKGEVDLNAADKCYKQTQNSVSEYEKLAVAERSVILDEVRCAHEQAAEKLHKEVREAILKEVVSERCKDEEEAVFLEEQIQTAQRDPAQMQELITAAKDIKEGDNHYLYNLDALKKEFSEREEQRALLLKRHAIEGDRLTKIKVAMKKQNDFDTKSINAELNTIIAEAEKALQKQHEEEEEKEQITLQKAKEALEEEQRNEEEEKKRKKDEKAPKRVIRAAPVQAKYAAAVDDGEWMYNLDALEKEFQERKKIRKKEVEHSTTRHKEEKQEVRAQVTQIAQAKASLGQLEKPSAPLPPPLQPVDTDKAEAMARQKLESKELENMWEAKKKEQEAGEKILLEAQESIKSIEREVTEAVSRKKDELNESDRQQKEAIAEEIDKANDSEETLEARKERFKDQEWMYDKEALDLEFSKRETKRCLKADIILDLHKREVMQQCTMLEGEDTARHTHTDMAEVVAEQEEDLDVVAAETAKRKAAADYDIAVKTFADTDRGCASFRIKRFNNLKEMRRAAESLDRYANNTTILWRPKMRNLVKLQLMLGRMNEEHRKEIIAGIRNGQEISRDTLSAKLSLSCTEDDIQHIATAIKQAQQEVQADAQMRAAAIEEQSKKIASDEKKALEKEQEAVKTVTSTPVDGEWMYNLDALEEDFKTREVQRKRRRILAQARADKTRGDGKAWLQQTFYRGDWMYDISTMVAEEQRMEALQMREDHDIEDSGRRGLREHLSSMYRIDNGSHEAEMGLKELEEEELLIKTRREAFEAELAEQHNNITEHVKYLQSRAEELKAFTWPPQENEPKEKEARVASADRENAFHRLRRESKAFHLTKQFSLQKAKRRHKAKKELLSLSGLISRAKARDAAVLQHRQHTEASFHIENLDKADSTVISLQRRRVQTNCNALQRAIVDAARAWYEVDIMRLSILRREEVQVAHDNYELCTSVDSCGTQLVAKPATSAALLHYMTESSVSSANNAGKAAHGALTLALQLRTAPVLLSALKVHELSSRLISSAEITLEDIKSVLDAQDYTLQEESKIVTVDLTEQCKEATALLEALDTNGCKAPLSIRTALLGKTSFRAVVPSAHERAVEQIEEALVKATVDEVDMDVYEAVLGDRLCQLSEHRETMMELDVCKCKVKLLKLLSGSEAEVFENTSGKIACRKYKRHETSSVFEKKLAKLQAEVYWHGKNDSFRPATELSMKNTPSPDMPPLLTYDSAMFYKLSLKESEATIKELIKEEVEAIQQEMRKEWDVSWACDAAMVELREQRHKKRTTLWSTTNIKRLQDRAVVGMTLNCGFGRCIANECNVMIAEAQGDHEAASDHRRQLDANVLGMQHKLLEEWVTEAEQWNDAVKLADIVPEHPDMTERTWPAAYCSYLDGMLEASCKTEDTIFQDLWNSRLTLMRTPGYLYDSAVHGIDALTRYYGAKLVKTISLSMDVVHVIELWKEEVTSFSISPTMLHSAPVAGYRMRDACIEEASLSTKHRRPSSCISDEELTMLEALRAHAAQDIKAASSPQLTLFEEGRKYFESLAATKLVFPIYPTPNNNRP
eukprot:TRINITY_DN5519_c1_g2_i2.p1 TRINITY_DN5519_c1_g2~~TRINITY_DN5519_c1_g2_i2.p1  ORF type:complete len:3296 (+),score=834.57 TRINITY_DN5519_c1_g2_i2:739-9888(+)